MIRALDLSAAAPVGDVFDLVATEARPTAGRPWLIVNMVSSLDGATAVRGGASGLTDPDDQAMFGALRAVADVVLVGASTVRAEDYGPVKLGDPQRAYRLDSGKADKPRLAIVSASLHLDPEARVFSDRAARPYIFTGSSPVPPRLADKAEVVTAGAQRADLRVVLRRLWADGHQIVLCEGGPTLNGQLLAADLVDELNLSVSPLVVGGTSSRVLDRARAFDPPMAFVLDRLFAGERTLLTRYLRDRPRSPESRP